MARRTPPTPLTTTDRSAVDTQGFDLTLSLYNYDKFKKELKEFSPKLKRAMDKEIRGVLTPVAARAKALVPDQPLSNWRFGEGRYPENSRGNGLPYWDPSRARAKIKVQQGGRRRTGYAEQAAWRLSNLDGAAAAFEVAGRVRPDNSLNKGLLSANLGRPRRLIWRAWYESKGWKTARTTIIDIVAKYEKELQDNLDASNVGP